jgi:predicted tellurium resistance membrane protein TerC
MLALDLLVLHRKAHAVSLREALTWSCVWVSLALLFSLGVYFARGGEKALEFLTGYVIEWSLSVDNLFVFLVIFSYFAVPPIYQHRVLFWGILGALVLRAIFIATGTALLANFHWMIYVFGGFLVFTGIKLLFAGEDKVEPEKNPAVRLLRRFIKVTPDYQGQRFSSAKMEGFGYPSSWCLGGDNRCYCRRFDPGHFRGDPGSVHCVHVKCLCHPGPSCAVLPARRRHRYVPLLRVGLSFVLCFISAKMMLVDFIRFRSASPS